MNNKIHLVGRILVGSFYLMAGLYNLMTLPAVIGYATFKGVPMPSILVPISALLLLVVGATILTGRQVKLGILAAVLFFVPVTLMMHNFWTVADPTARQLEIRFFEANIGLLGSTLMFMAIPMPWPYQLPLPRMAKAESPKPAAS